MSEPRTPSPSPPAGEGGRERSERPGEGAFNKHPSPASRLRRSAPSPAGGEGPEQASRAPRPAIATTRARALRSQMTDAERKLWFALRDRRFADFKFRRQHPIGPYVVDFACVACRVVIEADGESHFSRKRADSERSDFLKAAGWHVLRFWNTEIYDELEAVKEAIYRECVRRGGE